ncbi:putative TonB-dependent receptor [Sphingomonas changbaiensis NBRC 104936]|uniref:Putative TonB-dependent receptor n=1 Tax=Sphingomonas changbaiensis NBRC 104936 TaxID=1219043 RepID=A0A0E9MKY1_9SPHN|nr:TonB-dependent receptor [Sphingomonas changbaiensis]GAO38194.1 putative TonB-dependent receptor [Sphingomonas changbaiensis NBRC 104936]
MPRSVLRAGVAFVALLSTPAFAADAAGDAAAPPGNYHDATPADIVVTAPFERNRADVVSPVSVLSGTDLAREVRSTIGETLQRQPGVSSTSFGPNASRPILRGFQGDRVRILTDGIGSFDVSNTSVDHAVVINPLLAERVEVLRGPASLQFGSSAIGGVVNVIDKRIPRAIPDEPVHVDAIGTYSSASNQFSGSSALDVPVSDKVVLHLDGSYLDGDDLKIGGYVLSPAARAQALASANPEVRALADLKGTLANSAARTWEIAGGASVITDTGQLGFALSHYDSLYGVPARYDLTTGQGEMPRLDMHQTRVDARTELDLGDGFFKQLRGRFGFADYKHAELAEDGTTGTQFFNKGLEGRLELAQTKRGVWQGAIGGQLLIRDFNVIGDEAFVPKNETIQYGLFTLQTLDFGKLKTEFGGRIERTHVSSNPINADRQFTAYSGSAGASYEFVPDWRIGVNVSHTERAPSAEELFANGPHAGTQAFEIGNPNFKKERSFGLEGTLRGSGRNYTFEASAYYNKFNNYIYDNQTGEIRDGLPVFQSAQADANYYGFEAQATVTAARFGDWKIDVDGLADYVHATVKNVGPVPRIPPLRLLGGVSGTSGLLDGRVEVEHTFAQDRVAPFETTTPGYTLVNASIGVRPFGEGRDKPEILLSANNIFDVDARRHASFLKDFAPLAGRDIRVTLRASF